MQASSRVAGEIERPRGVALEMSALLGREEEQEEQEQEYDGGGD
jgi:hypothetical protein